MKELVKYSRVAGYLEKLYDKLNAEFFGGELTRPVITIQSTTRAYGHYTLYNAWSVKGEGYREINIAAGTLNRPIENVCATMLHEMVHQLNAEILKVQDCSRKGTYHNKLFKKEAEERGLILHRSEKYGWSHTEPSDRLIEWIIENDIKEIPMTRNDLETFVPIGGSKAGNSGTPTRTGIGKSNSRRWVCPQCGTIIRSTRTVNVICGDCMTPFIETT